MAQYSVWILEAGNITISGGQSLSGFTQGDGSHLIGQTIQLDSNDWLETRITDSDTLFQDNDGSQSLDGAQTVNGVIFADGTAVEAEYRLILTDPATGETWQVLGFNVTNSAPNYATVEGLAFVGPVGGFPPVGVALTVTASFEGPGSSGQPDIDAAELVSPPCFVAGTGILTPSGWRAVETLEVGDLVITRDSGALPLCWVGGVTLDAARLAREPDLRPVRIRRDAYGPNAPRRDLFLSPQHRILLSGPRLEMFFGEEEMLCAACHLVGDPSIAVDTARTSVSYHHILFGSHEIVLSDGLWTESFLPGPEALRGIPKASRDEVLRLFPALAGHAPAGFDAARPVLRGFEAALVA